MSSGDPFYTNTSVLPATQQSIPSVPLSSSPKSGFKRTATLESSLVAKRSRNHSAEKKTTLDTILNYLMTESRKRELSDARICRMISQSDSQRVLQVAQLADRIALLEKTLEKQVSRFDKLDQAVLETPTIDHLEKSLDNLLDDIDNTVRRNVAFVSSPIFPASPNEQSSEGLVHRETMMCEQERKLSSNFNDDDMNVAMNYSATYELDGQADKQDELMDNQPKVSQPSQHDSIMLVNPDHDETNVEWENLISSLSVPSMLDLPEVAYGIRPQDLTSILPTAGCYPSPHTHAVPSLTFETSLDTPIPQVIRPFLLGKSLSEDQLCLDIPDINISPVILYSRNMKSRRGAQTEDSFDIIVEEAQTCGIVEEAQTEDIGQKLLDSPFSSPLSPAPSLPSSTPYNSPVTRHSHTLRDLYSSQLKQRNLAKSRTWEKRDSLSDEQLLPMSDGTARQGMACWPVFGTQCYSLKGVKQEVECDGCHARIHWICAGLSIAGIPQDVEWYCPDCVYSRSENPGSDIPPAPRNRCIRPDCIRRRKQKMIRAEDDDDQYFVERIIGRRAVARRSDKSRIFHYLVKWHGYPISQSTWEPVEHLAADSNTNSTLVEQFEHEAKMHGAPLTKRVALLSEALTNFDPIGGDLLATEGEP